MKYFSEFPCFAKICIVLAHELQRKVYALEAFVKAKTKE